MGVMDSISTNAIIQFSELMHTRAQQITARLRPWVEIRQMDGKSMAYDGIGTLEVQEYNGRNAAVEFTDIEFFRRKISRKRFFAAVPLDQMDIEERLKDPQSNIADACVRAMERQFDRVVVGSMFADVYTGEDFSTTVTATNDGVLTVDATAGLTYEKLIEIHQNFIDNEVGNDMPEDFVLGITGGEHTDLMTELELTSGDYSREYVVDKGTIQRAVGIQLVKFAANGASAAVPGILPTSAGTRTSFCMNARAICVGLSRQWSVKIQERTDLVDTKQILITGVLGAVRTEGKLIQKVTTTV